MVQSFQDMDLVRDLFGTKGLLIYFTRCLRAESNWWNGSNKPETISYQQPSTPKVFSLLRVLEITGMKLLIWPFFVLLHSTSTRYIVCVVRDYFKKVHSYVLRWQCAKWTLLRKFLLLQSPISMSNVQCPRVISRPRGRRQIKAINLDHAEEKRRQVASNAQRNANWLIGL